MVDSFIKYCYINGNDIISFDINNDKKKATLTHMYVHRTSYKETNNNISKNMKEIDNESAT